MCYPYIESATALSDKWTPRLITLPCLLAIVMNRTSNLCSGYSSMAKTESNGMLTRNETVENHK